MSAFNAQKEQLGVRRFALLVHRYIGLSLALFLVVAGVTGSILVVQHELDEWLNPELFHASKGQSEGSPFEVARRTQWLYTGGFGWEVPLYREPGKSLITWHQAPDGRWRQRFIDPHTGALLGEREWGNIAEGKRNLVPFLYRLHFSLGLREWGTALFGLIAVFWTLDCFVGLYLTLPRVGPRAAQRGRLELWFKRWLPAWTVKWRSGFGWVFTWHRASGLWVWGMLLMLAWSAVGFNFHAIYRPVMHATLGMRGSVHDALPMLHKPYAPASLSPEQAYAVAKEHMARELARHGAELRREVALSYAPEHGAIVYRVDSSLDIVHEKPRTEIYIDAKSGAYLGFDAATGQAAGNTVTTWLYALHMGAVGGPLYRALLALVGIAVAGLSLTGAMVWWRKRKKRSNTLRSAEDGQPSGAPLEVRLTDASSH